MRSATESWKRRGSNGKLVTSKPLDTLNAHSLGVSCGGSRNHSDLSLLSVRK